MVNMEQTTYSMELNRNFLPCFVYMKGPQNQRSNVEQGVNSTKRKHDIINYLMVNEDIWPMALMMG